MSQESADRAQFTAMDNGTAEDWQIIGDNFRTYSKDLPNRVLDHLRLLDGDFGGFPIDRLQHSLQSATLAYRDGRDEEYVVMALLHDIGDTLGTYNHADIAATILQPFLSEKLYWIVKHHGIFQGYYFFHHIGLDRNARDAFKDHPYFDDCAEFCEKYDQNAFDPDYKPESLEFFEPMVRNVMERPKRSLYKAAE
ncbi:HD domain-containing protein [Sneathiella sp. P13V-1]|uniref:HD domain-containing protein n=1 Tax=Sneathiella sp. P13V-1 TaxID=2697366 RepID=UPI00187B6A5E|nr:HD domain-containing protein [Sneathiella sp. P13V-1]MBE7636262.1 HD domain-containing protein [Sneathiella sp. P13V-1]